MKRTSVRQRPRRVEVSYEGVLTSSDGHESAVVVLDLSAEGFRLEVQDELFLGETVELRIGKAAPARGEIKWVRGSEAGGVFL